MNKTFEEIEKMPIRHFKNELKKKISETALKYLLEKKGSKGKEIKYACLEMAEYLLPYNDKLNIEEKQRMYATRNRMVDIPQNFGRKENCTCGNEETMSHIYSCEYLNIEETELEYEKIFNGNITEQISIFRRFENNLKARNEMRLETETNDQPILV